MSDPKRIDADVALALAILELNKAFARERDGKRQGPAPEPVKA